MDFSHELCFGSRTLSTGTPSIVSKVFLTIISYILASWQELVMNLSLVIQLNFDSWPELLRNCLSFLHKYKSITQYYTQPLSNTQCDTERKGKQNINPNLNSQYWLFKALMSCCRVIIILPQLFITKVLSLTLTSSTALCLDMVSAKPVPLSSPTTLTHLMVKIIEHHNLELA